MRIILILIFNLMFAIISFAQFEQNNIDYYNLIGKVKSVEVHKSSGVEIHAFNEKGDEVLLKNPSFDNGSQFMNRPFSVTYNDSIISVLVFGSEGKALWTGIYQLNSDGKVFKEIWDNLSNEKSLISEFLYDDNGVLLSETICRPYFDNFDTKMMYTLNYFYDGDGFLCKTEKLDLISDKQIISDFTYRKNGVLEEKTVSIKNTKSDSVKHDSYKVKYDKKANEFEDLYKREHRLFMHASVAFAAAIDARDPYTHGHSERVTNFSLAILDCMGAVHQVDNNPLFRQRLQIAAVLHDIGKIGVPDDILHKPSKLSDKEWEAMRKHPVTGAEIVTHIKGLRDLIGGIRHHHERYDGKGYPDGLKSDEIPFMAKIIAVADTFDAMTSDRPYRKGLPVEVAREEIQRNAAAQFDPYMVAAFLKAYEQGAIKQSAVDKKVELIID